MSQQPHYHPIENLWLISQVIKGSVTQAKDLTKMLREAEHQPYVLDDTIIKGQSSNTRRGWNLSPSIESNSTDGKV